MATFARFHAGIGGRDVENMRKDMRAALRCAPSRPNFAPAALGRLRGSV